MRVDKEEITLVMKTITVRELWFEREYKETSLVQVVLVMRNVYNNNPSVV